MNDYDSGKIALINKSYIVNSNYANYNSSLNNTKGTVKNVAK